MVTPDTRTLRRTVLLAALAVLLAAASGTVAAQQDLEATFENDTVDGHDEPVNGTLTVTGHTGDVTIRSEDVSAETLVRMFDGRETEEGVRVAVPDDGDLSVTFPRSVRCSPGEYTFTVTDGERRATASVVVVEPAVAPASFGRATTTVTAGDAARIPIEISECHQGDLTLHVGGENASVDVEVTVAPNASGVTGGNVTVHTGNLTDPDAFEAGSGLVRQGLTVHGSPPNGSLSPGVYDLALTAGGEEYALATLQVEDRSGQLEDGSTGNDATTANPGEETDAGRSPLDMPGFGFPAALLALLAAVAFLYRGD